MHILYANQLRDDDLSLEQQRTLSRLRGAHATSAQPQPSFVTSRKSIATAQDWVTAFFDKGAEEVLGFYADDFVWEDIEFAQTVTTKEELYKAFVVFNNSGPDSPFGVHKFHMVSFDGGRCPAQKAEVNRGKPDYWPRAQFDRLAGGILVGADHEYDEWGYMQWIWQATHNEDFFGIPAKGKTTVTRGTTTQFYRNGKIVRCRTHWNFREFAMQLGLIPNPDEKWRENPGLSDA